LNFANGVQINPEQWELGRYCSTPTIIEAAMALYNEHSVSEISRNDASAINLSETSDAISEIIHLSNERGHKSICFVTGVPGAGKTLVGLNIATTHIDIDNDLYSVFLSGIGPLVAILREALASDKVRHERERGRKIKSPPFAYVGRWMNLRCLARQCAMIFPRNAISPCSFLSLHKVIGVCSTISR